MVPLSKDNDSCLGAFLFSLLKILPQHADQRGQSPGGVANHEPDISNTTPLLRMKSGTETTCEATSSMQECKLRAVHIIGICIDMLPVHDLNWYCATLAA